MRKKTEAKITNYLETFVFPDFPWQPYPVYDVSEGGNVFNLKSILYPSPKSAKKFTRRKQLVYRSMQAKIFDALINVGYFEPLTVVPEFPIIIQNHLRLKGQEGSYVLLDYYIPNLNLAIELDSDLHVDERDALRDQYLFQLGIEVFRIKHLERSDVQKKRFRELAAYMRTLTPTSKFRIFSFTDNIRLHKNL